MKQLVTTGIVLSRTNYGEADRIVTMLTPDSGKLHVMARGVRKIKSRMAAGIELFSVSEITYMPGRGELSTLLSARLKTNFGNIIRDIERVQLGYTLIRMLNRATEDQTEAGYFDLLNEAFRALDDLPIPTAMIDAWFQAQLLAIAGHTPNLAVDGAEESDRFNFDTESMRFIPFSSGPYGPAAIKTMRLLFADLSPGRLMSVEGIDAQLPAVLQLITVLRRNYLKQ